MNTSIKLLNSFVDGRIIFTCWQSSFADFDNLQVLYSINGNTIQNGVYNNCILSTSYSSLIYPSYPSYNQLDNLQYQDRNILFNNSIFYLNPNKDTLIGENNCESNILTYKDINLIYIKIKGDSQIKQYDNEPISIQFNNCTFFFSKTEPSLVNFNISNLRYIINFKNCKFYAIDSNITNYKLLKLNDETEYKNGLYLEYDKDCKFYTLINDSESLFNKIIDYQNQIIEDEQEIQIEDLIKDYIKVIDRKSLKIPDNLEQYQTITLVY